MPEEENDETGSGLRKKLESTLQENTQMAARLAELTAKDVLREKGLGLVKVDDLKGLKSDEIEAKAVALQEERAAMQRDLVKDALRKQGVNDDDLEERTEAFLSGTTTEAQAPAAVNGIQELSRISGEPVGKTPPSQLHGVDAIAAAFAEKK